MCIICSLQIHREFLNYNTDKIVGHGLNNIIPTVSGIGAN